MDRTDFARWKLTRYSWFMQSSISVFFNLEWTLFDGFDIPDTLQNISKTERN